MRIWLPIYLAFKEIWRNRLRFSLVTGIIALITILVLFVVALSDGLGFGNREYLVQLDADMLVYQQRANLLLQGSLITQDTLRALRRSRCCWRPVTAAAGGSWRQYDNNDLQLATGYGAKEMCSCLFVMEMPFDYCTAWTKASMPAR